jgi:chloramphenicol-sensitive protein RarD
LWGVFPFYFKALADVSAFEILSHRILWSAAFTLGVIVLRGKTADLVAVFAHRRWVLGLAGSALAISTNWLCFIWAVGHGHALESSLGYFIYPLCAVALGALVFKERLTGRQHLALLLVCLGVAVLAAGIGRVPWLVLSFPASFAIYSLLRKVVEVDALLGLGVETLILAPLALAYLATRTDGGAFFTAGMPTTLLLAGAGPVTAVPLLFFAFGARRLPLSAMGLLQYLNPTLQMSIAVLAFGETFTAVHALTFALIWSGLLLYSLPFWRRRAG